MAGSEYLTKYDVASEAAGSTLGNYTLGGLAVATDIVTTLWNSIPLTPNIRTEDVLGAIDKDALQVYQQHTDTIQTLSMIGGAIVPGGLGVKLLGRARAGVTNLGLTENFIGGSFTGARQIQLQDAITDIYKNSGAGTAAYRSQVRQLYASNLTKEVIDNAAIELAVAGGINAHPYMEDYWKDPVENIALGTLIGSGIGLLFAIPGTRRAIFNATGELATQVTGTVADAYKAVDPSFTAAAMYQGQSMNISKLTYLASDTSQYPITVEIASSIRGQSVVEQVETMEKAAGWAFASNESTKKKAFRSPEVETVVKGILNDPSNIGVDKIRQYDLDKIGTSSPEVLMLVQNPANLSLLGQLNAGMNALGANLKAVPTTYINPDGTAAVVFYRPSTGERFGRTGVSNVALAVDSMKVQNEVLNIGKHDYLLLGNPINNFGENNLFRSVSTARSDAEFLREIKLGQQKIGTAVVIAPDHLPRMNGQIVAASSLDDTARDALRWRVTSDLPTYQTQYVQRLITNTVGKDHILQIEKLIDQFNFRAMGVSSDAERMIGDWIHGDFSKSIDEGKAILRRAMDAWLRGTSLPLAENAVGLHQKKSNYNTAQEIWNAGAKFRDELRKVADADGYVYLNRGIHGKVQGASSVESYTTRANIGEGFGKPDWRKVHVDNVIGTVGNGRLGEYEILVGSPHHPIVDGVPVSNATTAKNTVIDVPQKIEGDGTIGFAELRTLYADETERQIRAMVANKEMSVEEISARLNVTKDGVHAVLGGGSLKDMQQEWRRYTDPDKIQSDYLAPKNKLYALFGNAQKNQMAEGMANLDARFTGIQHRETTEQMTLLSGSDIGNTTLGIFKPMSKEFEMLHERIGQINSQLVGNPIFQSADNFLRKLKDSSTITFIGQQVITQRDTYVKRVLTPLASKFLPVRDSPVALAEFNGVVNKLYSLSGWRDIEALPDGTARIVQRNEKGATVPALDNGKEIIIQQASVIDALEAMRPVSQEILKIHNLNRALTGQGPLNDLGFYIPPINLINKNHAYVVDPSGKIGTRLLVANTGPELADLMKAFNAENPGKYQVFPKADQEAFNREKGYTEYQAHTEYANVAFRHKGSSALAIVPSDSRFLENAMASYENLITQSMRKYTEIYMYDTMSWLDKMSGFHQKYIEGQPKRPAFKESVPDAALTVKNVLLGRDQLEQSPALKLINTLTDKLLNTAYQGINTVVRGALASNRSSKEFYDELLADLKKNGVEPMWKSFDEYLATTRSESKNMAPSLVSTGNGLLATMMLRIFETGQASVNVMSLPILTWSALMERLPATALNPDGSGVKFPLRAMYAGIYSMMKDPVALHLEKTSWEPKGLTDQTVRMANETIGALKGASVSSDHLERAVDAMRKIQSSPVVEMLSKPADWAEKFTRRFAMHTGYWAAKQAYPGLDDVGATIAAASFTDRVIGNYHAAQRPTAFQGTFGSMLGLFQTYFLTFAQHTYRGMEERNFKQLAALAATQAGIFGISSWPGFNLLSEQVVSRFNDEHYDLTTGTFRAADRNTAELILYGLPSSLGPAFYTRGDISPRIPSSFTDIAVMNGIHEGWKAAHQIATKTAQGIGDGQGTQALFEALSLQSLNRPIARWSELVTGHSITRQGNTVSPQNEVWTPMGITSRLFSVRPIEEQVVRNARHLDTFYGQIDFENRQNAVRKLKTSVRNGEASDTVVNGVAEEYLRFGGSAKGWNAAINEVLSTSNEGTRASMLRKLEPDSPLRRMIDDMY